MIIALNDKQYRWLFSLSVTLTYINLRGLAKATERLSWKNSKSKLRNIYRQACEVIHLMLPPPSTKFCQCKLRDLDVGSNIH